MHIKAIFMPVGRFSKFWLDGLNQITTVFAWQRLHNVSMAGWRRWLLGAIGFLTSANTVHRAWSLRKITWEEEAPITLWHACEHLKKEHSKALQWCCHPIGNPTAVAAEACRAYELQLSMGGLAAVSQISVGNGNQVGRLFGK